MWMFLLCCASPGDATEPPASPTPALAGTVAAPAGAGRYALRISRRHSELLTREHVQTATTEAGAWLELAPDESAHACLGWSGSQRSSISHFASQDGEDHEYSADDQGVMALAGSWTAEKGALTVRFTLMGHGSCVAPTAPGEVDMRCEGVQGGSLPGLSLACQTLDPSLGHLTLPVGPLAQTQAGAKGGAKGPEERLLLSASPGLQARYDQDWHDVVFTLKPADTEPDPVGLAR